MVWESKVSHEEPELLGYFSCGEGNPEQKRREKELEAGEEVGTENGQM